MEMNESRFSDECDPTWIRTWSSSGLVCTVTHVNNMLQLNDSMFVLGWFCLLYVPWLVLHHLLHHDGHPDALHLLQWEKHLSGGRAERSSRDGSRPHLATVLVPQTVSHSVRESDCTNPAYTHSLLLVLGMIIHTFPYKSLRAVSL